MDTYKEIFEGILSEIKQIRFHHAGYPFMVGAAILFYFFPCYMLGIFAFWVWYFFRHPHRVITDDPRFTISPADGKICDIQRNVSAPELQGGLYHKVSIFLSIFDVHVNRLPVSGKIIKKIHILGKYHHASHPLAGQDNERVILHIEKDNQDVIVCVQVSGWIARRIFCDVQEGDNRSMGETYGIIRFGSRVDLYVPASYNLLVKNGQGVRAGESILAQCG